MATVTGNEYDHITISDGTNQTVHYLKDNVAREDISDLKSASTLQAENVPDTVQSITFDSAGNVAQITHTRNSVAIRTDVFTFGESTITEVRTLNTGESLTIVTNTTTLQTTVTYAAA